MTTPQVWVSTSSPQIEYDCQTPGEHWELVGTIDTNQESDFALTSRLSWGADNPPADSPSSTWTETPTAAGLKAPIENRSGSQSTRGAKCVHPSTALGPRTS
jgi:hypothetical protein